MNTADFDLIYFDVEDAREPYAYCDDDDRSIPMAFCNVICLLGEVDDLEYTLRRLDAEAEAGEATEEDEEHRLDTQCLINMRFEEIDQLIQIFSQDMPATLDALVAQTAMLLALERPQLGCSASDETDLSTLPTRLVRLWLAQTAGRDAGAEFREFRRDIEYLVNLPDTPIAVPAS
jgi:hypothetical protein